MALAQKMTSAADTATTLGVAKTTVIRWIEQGLIPGVRLGGRWLVPESYVDSLFEAAMANVKEPVCG